MHIRGRWNEMLSSALQGSSGQEPEPQRALWSLPLGLRGSLNLRVKEEKQSVAPVSLCTLAALALRLFMKQMWITSVWCGLNDGRQNAPRRTDGDGRAGTMSYCSFLFLCLHPGTSHQAFNKEHRHRCLRVRWKHKYVYSIFEEEGRLSTSLRKSLRRIFLKLTLLIVCFYFVGSTAKDTLSRRVADKLVSQSTRPELRGAKHLSAREEKSCKYWVVFPECFTWIT